MKNEKNQYSQSFIEVFFFCFCLVIALPTAPIPFLVSHDLIYGNLTSLVTILAVAFCITLFLFATLQYLLQKITSHFSYFLFSFAIIGLVTDFIFPLPTRNPILGTEAQSSGLQLTDFFELTIWLALFFCLFKFKFIFRKSIHITVLVFLMGVGFNLSNAFFSLKPITNDEKELKWLDNKSQDKKNNIFLFIFDDVDASTFKALYKQNDFNFLEDFNFYNKTYSNYCTTGPSILSLFHGRLIQPNEFKFNQIASDDTEAGLLHSILKDQGYQTHFITSRNINEIGREEWSQIFTSYDLKNVDIPYIHNLMYGRYLLTLSFLRLLPNILVKISKTLNIDLRDSKILKQYLGFNLTHLPSKHKNNNSQLFSEFINKVEEVPKNNQFVFFYSDITHKPYLFDEKCNIVDSINSPHFGNRESQVSCSLNFFDNFISKLKSTSFYRDSLIIITSDHGHKRNKDAVPLAIKYPGNKKIEETYLSNIMQLADIRSILLSSTNANSTPHSFHNRSSIEVFKCGESDEFSDIIKLDNNSRSRNDGVK